MLRINKFLRKSLEGPMFGLPVVFPPKGALYISHCLSFLYSSTVVMDNCELKYEDQTRSVSTKNVTVSAICALFGLSNQQLVIWLKNLSNTNIFPNEDGRFPELEFCELYTVQVGAKKTQQQSKRNRDSSNEESAASDDDEFAKSAYRLANKKIKLKESKVTGKGKGKGPRAIAGPSTSVSPSSLTWYFKITFGELKGDKKIEAIRNCLVKCSDLSTCSSVKQELGHELMTAPCNIKLFDSDFLEITDSNGRVGKRYF